MSMYYSKIPISLDDLDEAFRVFNKTSNYLLDQARNNLDFVFKEEESELSNLLEFLKEWRASQDNKKIIYAATGRSLFMGAKILGHRMSMLGFNMDYPHAETEMSAPPSSKISEGDCVFAMTSSGRTKSVVQKVNFARSRDCKIIIFTANPTSKVTEGHCDIILNIPSNHNEEELKKHDADYIFSPLGTNSEFTNAIFAETLGKGLNELLINNVSEDECLKIMKECYTELTTTAKRDLTTCVQQCEQEIKNFLANLILNKYSEHTVHLLGRGRIFDMQIAPFEMRLRQMPHGFITSIIGYSPKNRPVKKGQLAVISTGSGALSMTARNVKSFGALVVGISSQKPSPFLDICDIKIYLPGRPTKDAKPYDYELRQYEGRHAEFAPAGSQFEINGSAFFEGIFAGLCSYTGVTEEDLKSGHANVE
ncbi:MAG: SIS domain-containing protein [Candidatus Helarchaeales archaeon]